MLGFVGNAGGGLSGGQAEKFPVVMPFDEDVETRVDGDALATWIAAPYDVPVPAGEGRIPVWASGFGFVVVILGIVLMVIGSAVVFSWLLDLVAG